SLAYLLPVLTAIGARELDPEERRATALYLSPTKALAADQLTNIAAMADGAGIRDARVAVYDGDTPSEQRRWVRRHGTVVLTNPDMLHFGILPGHEQWAHFFRALRYVVIDECHSYPGVFGSHVAMVVRRLRRIAALYRAEPTFVLASATTANPELSASRLIGRDVEAVTEDGSPRAGLTIGLWEPGTRTRVDGRGDPARWGEATGGMSGGEDGRAGGLGEDPGEGGDGPGRGPAQRAGGPLRRSAASEAGAIRAALARRAGQAAVSARARPAAPLRDQRGRDDPRRPRREGRADPRLRPLAPRCRAGRRRGEEAAGAEGRAGRLPTARRGGGAHRRLSGRVPRAGAAPAGGRA